MAEKIVQRLDDHLIIRTDFFDPLAFKYRDVFDDHFCSKESTTIVSAKILDAVGRGIKGVIHLGGARQTLFQILRPTFPNIRPISISESSMPDFPRDLSLRSVTYVKSRLSITFPAAP
jgi:hypothetical protein